MVDPTRYTFNAGKNALGETYEQVFSGTPAPAAGMVATAAPAIAAPSPSPFRYVSPSSPTPGAAFDTSTESSRYLSSLRDTADRPVDEATIRQERLTAAQSRIDAINKYYLDLSARKVGQERETGNKLNQEVRAANVRSGNMGSDFATSNSVGQEKANQKVIDQVSVEVENERQRALGEIYDKIDTSAQEEAKARRAEALGARQALVGFLEKQQTEVRSDRRASVTRLGSLGTTIDHLKQNPDYYQQILKDTGYSEGELQYELNKARNDATRVKYEVKATEDGKVLMYGIDPLTNQLVSSTVDTTIPLGYEAVMKEGTLYWQDASGNLTPAPIGEKKQIAQLQVEQQRLQVEQQQLQNEGQILQNQGYQIKNVQEGAGGGSVGDNPQLYGGLSTKTSTAVRAKVSAFKTEPVVQNFSTIQEGRNFAASIPLKTKNPADDQGLIYSLAKALDPGSVVREGEYATAQKYAQSWVSAYGKGVTQALAGTGFLSEQARKNIKETIERKYTAGKTSYDNVNSQYKTGINNLTGRVDGDKFLVEYAIPDTAGGDLNSSIESDIKSAPAGKTREQIITELASVYPELTKDEIASKVYTLIPDKK